MQKRPGALRSAIADWCGASMPALSDARTSSRRQPRFRRRSGDRAYSALCFDASTLGSTQNGRRSVDRVCTDSIRSGAAIGLATLRTEDTGVQTAAAERGVMNGSGRSFPAAVLGAGSRGLQGADVGQKPVCAVSHSPNGRSCSAARGVSRKPGVSAESASSPVSTPPFMVRLRSARSAGRVRRRGCRAMRSIGRKIPRQGSKPECARDAAGGSHL